VYQVSALFATATAKSVAVNFHGGKLTSDAGTLLLKLADQQLQLTERINACIHDPRDQRYIAHQQRDLLAQRIYALAQGYEDVNDHTKLRTDPSML